MKITVFHNVSTDEHGRLVGMLDGYQPGHALVPVAEYVRDVPDTTDFHELRKAAEEAYHVFNVGDDPDFGTPDERALVYRRRGNRSLSVGDVVRVDAGLGDAYLACASVGWVTIPAPEFFAVECKRHGTTSLEPAYRRR